jgi:hypothetical protein
VAELKNGSLLLTSRLGKPYSSFYCPFKGGALNCLQRGFARSDDGGASVSRARPATDAGSADL